MNDPTPDEPVRLADLELFTIDAEREVALHRQTGAAHLLSRWEATLLRACQRPRSVGEHLQVLVARAASGGGAFADSARVAELRELLGGFVARGLLTRAGGVASDAAGGPSRAEGISTVALTTRNRSSLVDRLVGEYEVGLGRAGRRADLLVVDDSDTPALADQTRAVLARRASQWPGTVWFADRSDRRDFAARLAAEAGVDPGVAGLAVLGDPRCALTTGGARNALLLALAGRRFLLTDDDTRYGVAEAPGAPGAGQPALVLTSAIDPTSCWFYERFEQALRDNPAGRPDLLGLHERLLGRPAAELVEAAGANLDRAGLAPSLDWVLSRRPAHVRATMMGLLGDCGMSAQTYLSFDPESLARLTRSETAYYQALRSRQILRRVAVPTVGPPAICFATNLGLDATQLLPPFAPVQRNSDGLFARLLRSTSAGALVGHLPAAIVHEPLEHRERDPDACWTEVEHTRWADLVGMLVDTWGDVREHEDVDRALPRLGRYLTDLAKQPLDAFEQALRRRFWRREARRQQHIAAPTGLPGFFLQRRLEYDRRHMAALCRPDYVVPRDLGNAGDLDASRRLSQELVSRLGDVLQAWPALWQAAATLRARGQQLPRSPGKA